MMEFSFGAAATKILTTTGVSHLEGGDGTIQSILVREGDNVQTGDELVIIG